jgi:hypothetical protein
MKKSFKKMFFYHWLVIFMLLSGNVFAQRTINGKVADAATNEPLPGVSIVISGTMSGTITDIDGNFTLSVPADKD